MYCRVGGCPHDEYNKECGGNHGICIGNECTCNAGLTGPACNKVICPNNCSKHGTCDREHHTCICQPGFKGTFALF